MTDEELANLRKRAEEILELAKGQRHRAVRKDLHEQYDTIMDRILREEDRRDTISLADHYRTRGLNPYAPCPTCGQDLVKK